MFIGEKGTKFCDCGRPLIVKDGKLWCPQHKDKIDRKGKVVIGKYSGYSSKFKGGYES